MSQVILPHRYVAQARPYSCGAVTAEVVLSTFGITVTEAQMIAECKTTVDGTADVQNINRVLNARTGRTYSAQYIRAGQPSKGDVDSLWRAAVSTIADNRRGMPINIWAQAPTQPPGYPNGLIQHYVTGVGIDLDRRLIYISDSARFSGIEHWWMSVEKLALNISPKGYGTLPPTGVPDDPYLKDVLAQLKPWRQLGNRTFVDALGALAEKWAA